MEINKKWMILAFGGFLSAPCQAQTKVGKIPQIGSVTMGIAALGGPALESKGLELSASPVAGVPIFLEAPLAAPTPAPIAAPAEVPVSAQAALKAAAAELAQEAEEDEGDGIPDMKTYSRLYDKALDEPFPEGVVKDEFFLERHLPMRARLTAVSLIEKHGFFKRLPKLMAKLKKAPMTLSDGTVLRAVQTAPKRGQETFGSLDHVEGGYLIIQKADQTTIAGIDKWGGSLTINRYGPKSTYPDHRMVYSKQSSSERLIELEKRYPSPEGLPDFLANESRSQVVFSRFQFGDGASVEGARSVARALDQALGKGEHLRSIGATVGANTRNKKRLSGQYALKSGWVKKYREIAKLVEKLGPQSFGDDDVRVRVGKVFKRTRYDENDELVTKTVWKDQGPLLIVQENAGSVSHAIRLNSLKQGALEIRVAVDSEEPFTFKISADGKVAADSKELYLYSIGFDVDMMLGELRALDAGK